MTPRGTTFATFSALVTSDPRYFAAQAMLKTMPSSIISLFLLKTKKPCNSSTLLKKSNKPRPIVVVQHTDYIEGIESLTVCPLTTVLSVASVRLRLKPNAETGLKEPSDIEIDKVTTIRKNRVSAKIGAVTDKDQAKINYALRVWLDL